MKQLLFISILFSQIGFSQVFTSSNLPIVKITSPAPNTINDTARVVCDMGIISNGVGNLNFLTDPFNNYSGKISIETRGSTSQQYPKKSYGFETQLASGANNNVSLLGLPIENDWILYAPYPDKTLIRDALTYDIFQKMGHYASGWRYCELFIDDEYLGVYILLERVKRDNNRVDVAKLDIDDLAGDSLTGGYIVKVDKLTGEVGFSWASNYNSEVVFQFHDPEYDQLQAPQVSYMQQFLSSFENTVNGPNFDDPTLGYSQWIESESFIDFFLLQELGRTVDGYRSSSFMHKNRVDGAWNGRLVAGPIWDFNLSYGNADYCDANLTTGWQYNFDEVCDFSSAIPFWWEKLLDAKRYRNDMKCRWEELRSGVLSTANLHNFIDSMATELQDARVRNFVKWPIIGVYVNWNGFVGATYEEDLAYLKTYIENRALWMDQNLPGICDLSVEEEPFIPKYSMLWPNPSLGNVQLGFTLKEAGEVRIEIVDMLGVRQSISTLKNLKEGEYIEELESMNLATGTYLVRVLVDGREMYLERLVKM